MRLLDLFCGAGGASIGYARAGWEVTGVDHAPQPRYPFTFVQDDALAYLLAHGHEYDAVHASPPCQPYSPHVTSADSEWAGTRGRNEPALIGPVRAALTALGRPYVIENVTGARPHMRVDVMLCGVMFGLPIPRHRLIESSVPLAQPHHPPCRGVAQAYARARGWDERDMTVTGKGRHAGTLDRWRVIMGWPDDVAVTQHGMREAIPPAYTEWLGARLWARTDAADGQLLLALS